ncbi:Uncharacterised protein [Shigella sonnei]|nr:Uncharacterised protein [Shigella sonnei]CSI76848.1 Uncharacterised protein [Shigella sonnei]CSS48646.1 Uncharacterised protein [Shigella sonnei]SRU60616.1 Uncharacterised protein [Shigella sonnei]
MSVFEQLLNIVCECTTRLEQIFNELHYILPLTEPLITVNMTKTGILHIVRFSVSPVKMSFNSLFCQVAYLLQGKTGVNLIAVITGLYTSFFLDLVA